ncbi:hypothetical protein COEREDRAFT_9998 [Coemansia reversa NRRL 1564]|uniref:Uncharacterized protein n=1 Tax=Coemansia reversa (strain ATCC 12441 / NRRL 1564) TaxID=763665 RepID=A0A2G5B6X7_COERN|nr:hypothetical protein COEREDRAFT_9998 [Coemansia reversa NRRL 1564]|eukprot:PIA14744.1 hypothetical protein COEREDRAFT_9998 [Coemansia reversa NRRL 1564]
MLSAKIASYSILVLAFAASGAFAQDAETLAGEYAVGASSIGSPELGPAINEQFSVESATADTDDTAANSSAKVSTSDSVAESASVEEATDESDSGTAETSDSSDEADVFTSTSFETDMKTETESGTGFESESDSNEDTRDSGVGDNSAHGYHVACAAIAAGFAALL